ncbi:Pisatin demethylase [Lachnellula suecica]|uniref:Pisatin demethylase n=1 Tax=Lachnellula suecica TaxID=602035 RepID=A0A8T9CAY8_9HELO|nr:Pisatin demethylase [Lachnellula suecica]
MEWSSVPTLSWDYVLFFVTVAVISVFGINTYCSWSRLSHIPGPPLASISSFWLLRQALSGGMNWRLKEANEKYGSLTRIGPNEISCNDVDVLRKITGARSLYQRGPFYDSLKLSPDRDNLLSTRDNDLHRSLKVKLAPGYSGKENECLETSIDDQIRSLVTLIEQKYLSDDRVYRPLDFARIAQFFTLDVITAVAFGDPFGYLRTNSDIYEFVKSNSSWETLYLMMIVGLMPTLGKILRSKAFRSLAPNKSDKLGLGKVMGVAGKIVAERFGPDKKVRKDMLGAFIAHGLSQEEANTETVLQIMAGSDTTATAIRATFLHILTSPLTYTTLLSEILTGIKTGTISFPVTDAEARKLPYLQAVIREGLRIWPPVTGLFLKTVPKGGETINGVFVPEGTDIGHCTSGSMYSKAVFGEDAEVFRPERWFEFGESEAEAEREKRMRSTVDEVFHTGKWMCAGKNVAVMELNKVFVEVGDRWSLTLESRGRD